MASSASRPDTLGPLNPGNVVSAALRLYRDRFKMYFGLSVKAYLWLLIPVYGWAKYFAIAGLMSRLAFQEVISQPETPDEARRHVTPKLWSFLGLALLIGLLFIAAYLVLIIAAIIPGVVVGGLSAVALSPIFGENVGPAIGVAVGALIGFAVFVIGFIWLISRLLIPEVPLAIEPEVTSSDSISRSWNLTKTSVVRIQFVVVAAFLINLPVVLVLNYLPQLLLLGLDPGTPAYWLAYTLTFVLSFLGGMVVLPFWQAVKGVLYYDLRSRREGLDLQLRNPKSDF
ncbi:MAG TPA: glycerophosphoryl diester phosphodiesterase membrane domain-containing protein [Trichocoleus sp.]